MAGGGALARLIVALFVGLCAAQVLDSSTIDVGARCEPFAPENLNCQGVVPLGFPIYLNSTTTQQQADGAATAAASAVLIHFGASSFYFPGRIALVRNFDSPCADRLYAWMCARIFRPCMWINFTGSAGTVFFGHRT